MISVVIAVKNDRRIDKTLRELVKIPKPEKTEILVVDASEGKLDDIRKKFFSVRWVYFHNKTNKKRTFVEQINLGSKIAKGNILAYIDADCTPTKNWLINLVKPIREERENIVSGFVGSLSGRSMHERTWRRRNEEEYDRECPTMNMAMNRDILNRIGPRDERFNYGSDTDFCWRAIDAGYKIRYNERAIIYHDWGNMKQEIERAFRYGEARVRLYKKHPSRWKTLFDYDIVTLAYPAYISLLPLTFLWPYYPLFILIPLIKNMKKNPLKVVFMNLIHGLGSLKELFFPKRF